ncbi:MAG: hypothetical protein JSS79_15820 [Bacteroidetes bacterium]|nr:hypothetical protein [Bacteroidota bacterium]
MKYALPFLFALFVLIACGKKSAERETKSADSVMVSDSVPASRVLAVDSLTEDEIFDMVMALPEVKERSAYVDKESKGERHLAPLLYGSPDANDNYYWVKVGEDNGTNFVTHFHFYVYPNRSIRYYDAANDTVMDLSAWRERLKASSDKSKILN